MYVACICNNEERIDLKIASTNIVNECTGTGGTPTTTVMGPMDGGTLCSTTSMNPQQGCAQVDRTVGTSTRNRRRARLRVNRREAADAERPSRFGSGPERQLSAERVSLLCKALPGGEYITPEGVDVIATAIDLMQPFLKKERVDVEAIVRRMAYAYKVGSQTFGEEDAARWGGDFKLADQEDILRDEEEFHRYGKDLEAMCRDRQGAMAEDRLTAERVETCLTDELINSPGWPEGPQDKAMLLDVAGKMDIPTMPDFVPNESPPPLRAAYTKVAAAVNKQMFNQWLKGLLIMLRTDTAKAIPGIHFSSTSWAKKKGVEAGRPIGDPSNAPAGQSTLNHVGLHAVLEAKWGKIQHPTLEDIVKMILAMVEEHGWDNIELWKMDLKAAFTLMWFKEQVVQRLAFELTEGFTMIHIAGFFGWTGTPFAFEAITRVLRHYVGALLQGKLCMYVDDLLACSLKTQRQGDMQTARDAITRLLGSNAVEDKKSEWGRVLEALGWRINLDTRTVTMSDLNLAKTLYAFYTVREDRPVEVRVIEGLASRASRCATVCRAMRPYKAALYRALRGLNRNAHTHVVLSEEAQVDVWMWRAYLAAIECDPLRMERALTTFVTEAPQLVICFDASLEGYGIGICTIPQEGAQGDVWGNLIAYTALKVPFAIRDQTTRSESSYQNHCEFVAVVIGMWLAGRMGYKNVSYILKGDSVSALTWAKDDRADSDICRKASICFSLLSIHLGMSVADIVHIPGIDNIICDGLSRGIDASDLGLPREKFIDFYSDEAGMEYLTQCDPLTSVGGVEQHVYWIRALQSILEKLQPLI